HRQPSQEVEVHAAFAVPETHTFTAHERDWSSAVRLHHVRGIERDELLERRHDAASRSIMVPIPSRVKNSNSSACGTRPSSTCTPRPPAGSASEQERIFGITPPLSVPSASSFSSSSSPMREMSDDSSPKSRYRPATLVR